MAENRKRTLEQADTVPKPPKRIFPRRVPAAGMNRADFEGGFDDGLLKFPLPSGQLTCCICENYPRAPAIIECGHMACEYCLAKYFSKKARQPRRNEPFTAPCPVCTVHFSLNDINDKEIFSSFDAILFNSIELKCPQLCGRMGNADEMDDHDVYQCPLRIIRCPNIGCNVELPARQLEDEHFQTCTHYHTYCSACLLPVTQDEHDNHNCIRALQAQITSMKMTILIFLVTLYWLLY